jgi:hypothetical protein
MLYNYNHIGFNLRGIMNIVELAANIIVWSFLGLAIGYFIEC